MIRPKLPSLALAAALAAVATGAPAAQAGTATLEPCVASPTKLCLAGGRFHVSVTWRDFFGNTGSGHAVTETADSGLFWFFSENNLEMLVKVLDGCELNDRYWVFAAATTSVEYDLTVKDATTGAQKRWHNPLGTASPAITDTGALAVCP